MQFKKKMLNKLNCQSSGLNKTEILFFNRTAFFYRNLDLTS